jgi:hypothetical protein
MIVFTSDNIAILSISKAIISLISTPRKEDSGKTDAASSPDFWLNVQPRSDLWEAMHSPRERERIKRARPLTTAA